MSQIVAIQNITAEALATAESKAIHLAQSVKSDVLFAGPNELFIDLDEVEKHKQFVGAFDFLQKQVGYPEISAWHSKSQNIHIVLKFKDIAFSPDDQIKWQLTLGSDPERERWNSIKCLLFQEKFNILFRPKGAAETYKRVPIMLWDRHCGHISVLTHKEYMAQLSNPDRTWSCSNCGSFDCMVIE